MGPIASTTDRSLTDRNRPLENLDPLADARLARHRNPGVKSKAAVGHFTCQIPYANDRRCHLRDNAKRAVIRLLPTPIQRPGLEAVCPGYQALQWVGPIAAGINRYRGKRSRSVEQLYPLVARGFTRKGNRRINCGAGFGDFTPRVADTGDTWLDFGINGEGAQSRLLTIAILCLGHDAVGLGRQIAQQ
ncbi:hypothetical protein D3C79_673540 [compost metagenome]